MSAFSDRCRPASRLLLVGLVAGLGIVLTSAVSARAQMPAEAVEPGPRAQLAPVTLAPNIELPGREEFTPLDTEYTITEDIPAEIFAPYGQAVFPCLASVPLNYYGFTVADSWRGLPDGHYQNNNGAKKGVNLGLLIPGLEELGIGVQLGGSFALYDTTGRASVPYNTSGWQQQAFVTGGLFRRATPEVPVAAAIVYDGMINKNYGEFAESPYLGQLRIQTGYAVSDVNEIGFWCALHMNSDTHQLFNSLPIEWRGINQYNLFWHHKYVETAADTWFWLGVPEHSRLNGQGSLGQLILGSSGSAPITDRLVLYGNAAYMMPSAHPSAAGSTEDAFYVGFGVAVYPRRNARQHNVRGNPTEPYLPVADNGSFFVDTSRSF
ncbi:MAG TPA: DUF6666 family protein [Pirellulales bacterium]|jgi:hypothetical protein|nr:DUF6666 family protein [Pirellulales bacterium]